MQVDPQPGWGNYSLRGIEEAFLPDPVSLFPETIGWAWVLGFTLLLLLLKGLRTWQHWKQDYYRRWALKQIKELNENLSDTNESLARLPELLKITAINAYGRKPTASLTGGQWLAFLDASFPRSKAHNTFEGPLGELLLELSYQPSSQWKIDKTQATQLIDLAKNWIRNHKEKGTHA
ncbi:MAG: DUF4381 domain-containing protein [Opitutaceae bacterium]|nr:DUF4381 domain-containing protein [Opitutaceae bacterium]